MMKVKNQFAKSPMEAVFFKKGHENNEIDDVLLESKLHILIEYTCL